MKTRRNARKPPVWRIGWVVLLCIVGVLGFVRIQNVTGDYKIVTWGEEEIELITVSPERGLDIRVELPSSLRVWIPDGYGWYSLPSGQKLIAKEAKAKLYAKTIFLNFGFLPDKVITPTMSMKEKVATYTDWHWWYWKIKGKRLAVRRIMLDGGITTIDNKLDASYWGNAINNIWTTNLGELPTIAILNASREDGWAEYISHRFEWSGWWVTKLGNADEVVGDSWCQWVWYSRTSDPKLVSRYRKEMKYWSRLLGCDFSENTVEDSDYTVKLIWQRGLEGWSEKKQPPPQGTAD